MSGNAFLASLALAFIGMFAAIPAIDLHGWRRVACYVVIGIFMLPLLIRIWIVALLG